MHRRLTVPMPLRRVRDTLSEGSRTVCYLAALPLRVRLMGQTVRLLLTQTITSSSFQVTTWQESYGRLVSGFVPSHSFHGPTEFWQTTPLAFCWWGAWLARA